MPEYKDKLKRNNSDASNLTMRFFMEISSVSLMVVL